jgi:hypothetical protein
VARLGAEERFAPGRALRLTFDARQLHLFGADGRRLEAMVYSARQ